MGTPDFDYMTNIVQVISYTLRDNRKVIYLIPKIKALQVIGTAELS